MMWSTGNSSPTPNQDKWGSLLFSKDCLSFFLGTTKKNKGDPSPFLTNPFLASHILTLLPSLHFWCSTVGWRRLQFAVFRVVAQEDSLLFFFDLVCHRKRPRISIASSSNAPKTFKVQQGEGGWRIKVTVSNHNGQLVKKAGDHICSPRKKEKRTVAFFKNAQRTTIPNENDGQHSRPWYCRRPCNTRSHSVDVESCRWLGFVSFILYPQVARQSRYSLAHSSLNVDKCGTVFLEKRPKV